MKGGQYVGAACFQEASAGGGGARGFAWGLGLRDWLVQLGGWSLTSWSAHSLLLLCGLGCYLSASRSCLFASFPMMDSHSGTVNENEPFLP